MDTQKLMKRLSLCLPLMKVHPEVILVSFSEHTTCFEKRLWLSAGSAKKAGIQRLPKGRVLVNLSFLPI